MDMELRVAVVLAIAIGMVLVILWALFGPRRRSDESGHHVDLAEQTRRRDAERRHRGSEDSGTD